MPEPFMVDLFSGLGGASEAMRDRGWRVVTIELDPVFRPSIVADVMRLPLRDGLAPDLLWASPPCEEFSRTSMPWLSGGVPSLLPVAAAVEAVRRLRPRFWIIENVKGAVPWLTPTLRLPHTVRIGAAYLWGDLPPMLLGQPPAPRKERMWGATHRAERAEIPYEISEAVAVAVENTIGREAEVAGAKR